MNRPLPRRGVKTERDATRLNAVPSKNETCDDSQRLDAARFFATLIFFLIPTTLFIGVFWRSFDGDARFSYRDVAYFYYPLFEQIQNEWSSGRLPLWDPFENLGQPLAGNPAASVFYPGKAIFFLSSVGLASFANCFKIYIYAHIFLAFFGVYFLSRRLKISPAGATFAGISFAFSGQILFQYSNVIFLVGAAWLPFAFLFAFDFFDAASLKRKLLSALKLSVVESFALLGGEPQIVYLSLVAFGFLALSTPLNALPLKTLETSSTAKKAPRFRSFFHKFNDKLRNRVVVAVLFLSAVGGATFLLSAIQVLPSLETIRRSERSVRDVPRSIWEIPSALSVRREHEKARNAPKPSIASDASPPSDFYAAFRCADVENRGQSRSTYRFSVGPWRWLEFVFPNVGGRQFPQSSRWFAAFPEEIAVWTPTLYFGVLPFLLAICAARFRQPRRRDGENAKNAPLPDSPLTSTTQAFRIWLSRLTVAATIAGLGGFGVVWAFRFLRAAFGDGDVSPHFQNGDPVGGVYWFCNLFLPKFAEFRYPAKLLTLSAASLSVLAGFGWDEEKFSRRFRVAALVVFAVAVAGALFVSIRGPELFASVQTVDPLFGPFQPELAFSTVRAAFAQTAGVLATSATLLFIWRRCRPSLNVNDDKRLRGAPVAFFCSFGLLATTALDVGFANGWTITTAPTRFFERRGPILQTVENERLAQITVTTKNAAPTPADAPPTRVYRFPVWFPTSFQQKSSPDRTEERVLWDVLTLFPKYPFRNDLASIDARGTASDAEYAAFVDALATRADSGVASDLEFLDVSYHVAPQALATRFHFDETSVPNGSKKISNSKTEAKSSGVPNGGSDPLGVAVERIAATPRRVRIFRDVRPDERSDERAEVVSFQPNRIVYFVKTNAPADVVFSEQFWPDWFATEIPLSTQEDENELLAARFDGDATRRFCQKRADFERDVPVEKEFRFLRKISVDAGSRCVVFVYKPRRVYWGTAISAAAWSGTLAFAGALFLRRLPKRRKNFKGDKESAPLNR